MQFRMVTCGIMCSIRCEIRFTAGEFQPIEISFTVQFGSSINTSNVCSEGAWLESQLQHHLPISPM
jgi:hypothetical protein